MNLTSKRPVDVRTCAESHKYVCDVVPNVFFQGEEVLCEFFFNFVWLYKNRVYVRVYVI